MPTKVNLDRDGLLKGHESVVRAPKRKAVSDDESPPCLSPEGEDMNFQREMQDKLRKMQKTNESKSKAAEKKYMDKMKAIVNAHKAEVQKLMADGISQLKALNEEHEENQKKSDEALHMEWMKATSNMEQRLETQVKHIRILRANENEIGEKCIQLAKEVKDSVQAEIDQALAKHKAEHRAAQAESAFSPELFSMLSNMSKAITA